MRLFRNIALSVLFFPALAAAQQGGGQQGAPCMPGMKMPGCPDTSGQQAGDQQSSAGQPAQPASHDGMPGMQMNPYFTAFNYPIAKDTMMVMLLPDFQSARSGPNFFTAMEMVEYGITPRWSAGLMVEDWKRVNFTFDFISETGLESHENDFGYAWGIFRQAEWMGMSMGKDLAGKPGMTKIPAPPALSLRRLGFGLEMIGALGNTHQFGFYWQRQQHYLGPVFSYALSPQWTFRLEPTFGLSDVSDPFVLRIGLAYSMDHFVRRLARAF
jgi:hypothetical protein